MLAKGLWPRYSAAFLDSIRSVYLEGFQAFLAADPECIRTSYTWSSFNGYSIQFPLNQAIDKALHTWEDQTKARDSLEIVNQILINGADANSVVEGGYASDDPACEQKKWEFVAMGPFPHTPLDAVADFVIHSQSLSDPDYIREEGKRMLALSYAAQLSNLLVAHDGILLPVERMLHLDPKRFTNDTVTPEQLHLARKVHLISL